MKRILLAALAILLTACLSPSGAAPQTSEPTPTATALPTATATISPTPTSTQTPQPTPTPDVSVMSDEEKLNLVPGYEGENKYVSSVFPNIVIIDDGSRYLAYDIQTGDEKSLSDAGIFVLSTKSGEKIDFEAYALWDVRRVIESDGPYQMNSAYISDEQRKEQSEFYKMIYSISNIDMEGFRGGFPVQSTVSGEFFGVFILGVRNSDGTIGTLLTYVDSEDTYQVKYVYGDPETVKAELWYRGSLP
jgi:hypothetical protein